MSTRTFAVWRGAGEEGALVEYDVETEEGMVVLDAMREIQRWQAEDLAIRWNCKAAKCGSCSAEVNGKPCLMCKTRLDELPEGEGSGSSRCGPSRSSAISSPTSPGTTR